MNIETLKARNLILYDTIIGSHAYGTNNENSDVDKKGFYWIPLKSFLGLHPPISPKETQISDEKNDKTYYTLFNAFELLRTANPNAIELLWTPQDCVLYKHPIIEDLFDNRDLFITKQAYHSHFQYALAQVKKAKGKNKKVHNPAPKERPVKEDFCRAICWEKNDEYMMMAEVVKEIKYFPCRPESIKDLKIDLSKFHVASLEHVPNVYRLYYYGDKAKGVFRGNDMLTCESIPKNDEWDKFYGLFVYDKTEYDRAVKQWHSYWDWVKNRNDNRWIDQEQGLLNYDAKNMCHCVRLMMSAMNILTNGEPKVRFEGEERDLLMSIRNGELEYEDLMERVEIVNKHLKTLFQKSSLPEKCDEKKLDKLYRHLMKRGEDYFSK